MCDKVKTRDSLHVHLEPIKIGTVTSVRIQGTVSGRDWRRDGLDGQCKEKQLQLENTSMGRNLCAGG